MIVDHCSVLVLVLRVHLCVDEVAVVSIDTRTGHINIRDIGDLAAAGRGPRFTAISQRLHEAPSLLPNALASLRYIVCIFHKHVLLLKYQNYTH